MLREVSKVADAKMKVLSLLSASVAAVMLVALHFMDHGMDLNPVHHWLSEYVLSKSIASVWMMRIAFVALAGSALAVGFMGRGRSLFWVASSAMAAMPFFDTNRNDGVPHELQWPPTPGNIHKLLLYVAIGATLIGMGGRLARKGAIDRWLFGIAAVATAIQFVLVTAPHPANQITRFGGLTERLLVGSMLIWVASVSLREVGAAKLNSSEVDRPVSPALPPSFGLTSYLSDVLQPNKRE